MTQQIQRLNAGGTGETTQQAAINALSDVASATEGQVLKAVSGDAVFDYVTENSLNLSDTDTADASTAKHGLLPKLSGQASQYLGGDGDFHDLPTTISLFLDDVASDISGYKALSQTHPAGAEANVSASIAAADTLIKAFAAPVNQFGFISAQVLHTHLHAAKTAGTKTAIIYAKVYHRDSGGTETLLGTSENSINLTGSNAPYDLDVAISDTVFADTDRIVLKIFSTPGGAGTAPTVVAYYQGTSDSRLEIGTTPVITSGSIIFQRNITTTLTLADGECMVISDYLNMSDNDVNLDGDSILEIL